LTLYGMGAVIVPAMLALMVSWVRSGQLAAGGGVVVVAGRLRIVAAVLGAVFGVALGTAVAASVLVHLLGWWLGVPVAAAVTLLFVVRPETGAAHRVFLLLRLPDRRIGLPPSALQE
jgi:hypothetical protein